MLRAVSVVLVCISLSGCAYLTTYQQGLGSPDTGVSMDAKQRVVLVNTVSNQRRMCAEPSPDALSAIGASLNASFLSDTSATKQLAAALGESSGSIGLRTTSIQLMRDAMYRACEAYLSGGISAEEYADLQAHSQTLVVGLLAIEQLTGAVQAQQIALVSNVGAGGMPDVVSEADNLTQAKKVTLAQKQVADEAVGKRTVADKAVTDKQAEIDLAKKDAKATDEAKSKLDAELVELNKVKIAAATEAQKQAELLAIDQQAQDIAQQAFDLARTRVRATVSGNAKFSQNSRGNMSDATAAAVAGSIKDIVNAVVGQSIESQRCIKLMSKKLEISAQQLATLTSLCDVVKRSEDTKIDLFRRSNKL